MRLINRKIEKPVAIVLGAAPFAILILIYTFASNARLAANPRDKLLPSFETMGATLYRMAFVEDKRSGDLLFWLDTTDSLIRLGLGISVATVIALIFGIAIGFLPHVRTTLNPFVAAISLVPPITVLPILFIMFGLGELSKVMLIVVGTTPIMVRTLSQAVMDIPRELIIKAETLGASVWQMVTRIVLPQVLPKLITAVRLGLVPAWIFLISAEAIASTSGLGYRIFLVRRYLAMDVILPYVFWITVLAYLLDRALNLLSERAFRWHHLST